MHGSNANRIEDNEREGGVEVSLFKFRPAISFGKF
jgi:hypothetical protein